MIAPERILLQVKFMSPDQIHLAFDGHHSIGAGHHQKLVAIDDSPAFCGGIDLTAKRWNGRDHLDDNPLRRDRDGQVLQPWHDASAVFDGPAAAAISELARRRWRRAHDAPVEEDFAPVPICGPTAWGRCFATFRWPSRTPIRLNRTGLSSMRSRAARHHLSGIAILLRR